MDSCKLPFLVEEVNLCLELISVVVLSVVVVQIRHVEYGDMIQREWCVGKIYRSLASPLHCSPFVFALQIHQLAGHSQKITCVRLFPGEKSILTASADRSIRIWDISRHIYTQATTFRHSSTTNCTDVSGETNTVATGHLDGGVRFWDVRTGDRALDIPNLHEGGVTSVQWNPKSSHEILTNGRDSTLKIVDARVNCAISTFHEVGFRTLSNYASSSFSPDGLYVAAGGGDTGDIFVWNVAKNKLVKKLSGHDKGVLSLAWGRGGTNGQQVATIGKDGVLILWA